MHPDLYTADPEPDLPKILMRIRIHFRPLRFRFGSKTLLILREHASEITDNIPTVYNNNIHQLILYTKCYKYNSS